MIAELLLKPEVWVILGVILIVVDFTVGLQFFALSFGCGAFLTAGLVYMSAGNESFFFEIDDWTESILLFAVGSVASLVPIRYFAYRKFRNSEDINDY